MRAPNETRQTMVVHGKIWWTRMRGMVAFGGHAPVANRCEFEFEKGGQISNSKLELDFKLKAKF